MKQFYSILFVFRRISIDHFCLLVNFFLFYLLIITYNNTQLHGNIKICTCQTFIIYIISFLSIFSVDFALKNMTLWSKLQILMCCFHYLLIHILDKVCLLMVDHSGSFQEPFKIWINWQIFMITQLEKWNVFEKKWKQRNFHKLLSFISTLNWFYSIFFISVIIQKTF